MSSCATPPLPEEMEASRSPSPPCLLLRIHLPFPSSRYTYIHELSKSLFGDVSLWFDEETKTQVVIKTCDKSWMEKRIGRDTMDDPRKEIECMRILKESEDLPSSLVVYLHIYENADTLYIVMPYYNGREVYEFVTKAGPLSESVARTLFVQLLIPVYELHRRGFCHRDLSLENFLLHMETPESHSLHLTDFGAAMPLSEASDPESAVHLGYAPLYIPVAPRVSGKLPYIAPETYSCQAVTIDGVAADLYGMGIILFICLFGVFPYSIPLASADSRFEALQTKGITFLLDRWDLRRRISPSLHAFLCGLICPACDRMTWDDLWSHPWIKEL